ncbi:disease resistance protein RUN1-like isoform X2 [Argentina anserina]|uniref:disease resistance protein RUN1-like isoform X2 n=1 Tax=Argentina anserina TaxID=57926 RepID=UPI0021762CD8|nr:disease resistance protein RUN1-like isoform X2 [Potentilla anserina]
MASSSVVPPKEESYDVFLSFRGLETRQTFTSHLHAALIRRKVETYIDYRLERGDEVGPALFKAIKKSKISVIIFSKDYASSTWCLDELAYILECKKIDGQHVIPIFYEVEPSHVRHQTGTYETAFAKQEQRLKDNPDKVAKWKGALVEAANLSGFDSKAVRDDSKLVEEVVSDVLAKLKREPSIDLTRLIGAEDRIQKIILELDIIPEDVRVRCIVLWGMGGIGKTTLAEAVYYGLSSQFKAHCFLANVRECSGTKQAFSPELCDLRNELLGQLLEDRILNIRTPTIDDFTKSRLRRAKVLVVLDDVNDSSQLRYLAGEVPFGPGSRIIVTTRDMQPVKDTLLVKNAADYDVKIYKVKELNVGESIQLLHSNAPIHAENSNFLKKVVNHAAGVPLALEILRPLLCKCETEEQLVLFWAKLQKFPSKRLGNVYRASYDGLEQNEKELFLDVACFHKGKNRCDAERILAARGLYPDGIDILIDMSLISIKDDCIWMHDVIQEMAWETVHEESPKKTGERSRLHNYDDVCSILEGNKGTANVHCISYTNDDYNNKLKLDPRAFTGMDNLTFLELFMHLDDDKANLECLPDALRYLNWFQYPLQSLPSKFSPDNLVELHMPCSKLKRLWGKSQNLKNLKRIDLSWSSDLAEVGELSNSANIESINLEGCESLVEVPDLSNCTHIKSINLAGCESLVQVPSYFEKFTKLTHLDLKRCSKLRILPDLPGNIEFLGITETEIEELTPSVCSLEKLRELDLNRCRSIEKFSSSPWKMRSLNHLCLRGTKIQRVPSLLHMTEITSLDLRDCDRLVSLAADICELKSLETLDLSGCSSFTTIPEIAEPLEHIQDLNLSKTNIKELPSSIGNLVGITKLNLSGCTNLESLPDSFDNLKLLERFLLCGCVKLKELPLRFTLSSLTHLDLEDCELVKEIPDCSTSFPALQFLYLSGTMIETIPPSIKKVSGLKSLRVKDCKRLQSLPVLPCLLVKLDAEGCTSLKTVPVSVTARTLGLDEMLSEMESGISNDFRTEFHSFLGCVNLYQISKRRIMDDAYFRIMRLATTIYKLKSSAHDHGVARVICPGNKIPKWVSYQTPQGSSLNIKLPLHWSDDSNSFSIALCSVFAISAHREILQCDCEMILKNNNGETHTVNLGTEHFVSSAVTFETDHMLVWYVHGSSDKAKSSTEATFHFYTNVGGKKLYNVKSCGVCFLGNVYRASYDELDKLKLDPRALPRMTNLRFLKLNTSNDNDMANLECLPGALRYLDWEGYPFRSLPSKFSLDNLVELHMCWSKLKRFWLKSWNLNLKMIDLSWSPYLAEVGGLPNSVNVESIDLQDCESLVEVPDLSKCTRIKRLNLAGCESLVQVPSYFQSFTKLTHLDLSRTAIEELPPSVLSLEKLLQLNLDCCSSIKNWHNLSSIPWKMISLEYLALRWTKIERVPLFSYMTEITSLHLRDCDRLVCLPADICKLKSLQALDLSGCSRFTTFPEIAEPMEHLQDLNLSKTNLKELPSAVGNKVGIRNFEVIPPQQVTTTKKRRRSSSSEDEASGN